MTTLYDTAAIVAGWPAQRGVRSSSYAGQVRAVLNLRHRPPPYRHDRRRPSSRRPCVALDDFTTPPLALWPATPRWRVWWSMVSWSRSSNVGLVTFRNVRSWAIHVEFRELPRRCALPADVVVGCRRLGPIGCPRRTSSGGVGGREPVSAKAVGPVPGAEGQASTGRRFHPLDAGGSESMVRLARTRW